MAHVDTWMTTDHQVENSSLRTSAFDVSHKDDASDHRMSSPKKLTKVTGPFSVQDLSHLLKTSTSLRAQIFPSSHAAQMNDDGNEFTIQSISTGYVNHAFTLKINKEFIKEHSHSEFFIKINKNQHAKQMFDAETIGLDALRQAYMNLIRVPQTLATGYLSEIDPDCGGWFLSEFVAMKSTSRKRSDKQYRRFAEILAKLHQISMENHSGSLHRGQYGFHTNNFCIHTEQDNTWQDDWCYFFTEQRFKPVVRRMKSDPHAKNMELILLCERLIPHIPWFLASTQAQIRPCLLHGDLFDPNWSVDEQGRIVTFDGTPFYGPYEVDIYTMSNVFIQAYFQAIVAPVEGYEMRFELYNLLRLLTSVHDMNFVRWRSVAFESVVKLLTHCGAWTSSLVRLPQEIKTPIDKLQSPSSTKKNKIILVYGGSFCPVHLNHLAVMDFVAETLENWPYKYEILGGYFCPADQRWIQRKLPDNYLSSEHRESLLMLATKDTRWMVDRSYATPSKHSDNILKAIHHVYDENIDVTIVHICGIDAIENNGKRVPTQYPLVVVDRPGYNGEILWKDYFQATTMENRERIIWISPWKGVKRSSTIIRDLLCQPDDPDIRVKLQNFLPLPCIDYIFEYELQKWFRKSQESF